ncbi:MAG: glycosyltransferase [Rhodospirillales bacterium]
MTATQPEGLFLQSGTAYQELDQESYVHVISSDMAAALSGAGAPCRPVNLLNADDVQRVAAAIVEPPDFLLTLNLMPLGFMLNDRHYADLLSCKVFCLCLDSPIRLADLFAPGRFERLHDFYFGILEDSHRALLEEHGIAPDRIFPFPHGGPPVDENAPAFGERGVDIMFSGGIGAAETPDAFFDRIGIHDTGLRKALEDAAENTLAGAGDVVACIGTAFCDHGIEPNDSFDRAAVFEDVDAWTRTLRRHRLFAALKNLEIHFHGKFDESFVTAQPNGVFHEPVSYRRVIELSKNAKITVNDTINLMDSALFRFYYALADGCLMATETNTFIAAEFEDGVHAIHLDARKGDNADKIEACLRDPTRGRRIVAAAQARYRERHTWAARMPALLRCIRA